MRQRLIILGYLALFWLLFVIVIRATFLLYNYDLSQQLAVDEIFNVFLHGFRMDISLVAYFVMASALLLTATVFTENRLVRFTLYGLNMCLLVASAFLATIDMELYRHWGFRLNTAPLFYLQSAGSAALGSVALSVVIQLLFLWVGIVALHVYLFSRFVVPEITGLKKGSPKQFAVLTAVAGLMILPIRGSFTVAPMNTGFVYFHNTKSYANHSAINVIWNFMYHAVTSHTRLKYPEDFMPRPVAEEHFRALYPPHDSVTTPVLKSKRPNVILFILESFTAKVIEPLGGLPGITPNLNQLCGDGILFTNFYASGDRTDKGLISILSGYPAQPTTSIIKDPAKTQRLAYLNHNMLKLGYHTSFVYGGDIDFANFRSYLTNSSFDHITTFEDFPDDYYVSKWGVHDQFVFDKAFQQCDTARSPFFKVVLSLSSHEPFDVPMAAVFPGTDHQSLFLNSCHYTDKSIGEFMAKAKRSSWWENTLVIFIADHGHPLPGNDEINAKNRYRIPLLMVGGAVEKDSLIHKFGGQTDLANTLLAQLEEPSEAFTFSKDILSPSSKSFATYFFNDGFGFVAPGQYIVYDNVGKQFLHAEGGTPEGLERSRSYEQILFTDYNRK